jgi:hypothetical protein
MANVQDVDNTFTHALAAIAQTTTTVANTAAIQSPVPSRGYNFYTSFFWTVANKRQFPTDFLVVKQMNQSNWFQMRMSIGCDVPYLAKELSVLVVWPIVVFVLGLVLYCITRAGTLSLLLKHGAHKFRQTKAFVRRKHYDRGEKQLQPPDIKYELLFFFILLCITAPLSIACFLRVRYIFYEMVVATREVWATLHQVETTLMKLQPSFQNFAIWNKGWETSCLGWSYLKPALRDKIVTVLGHVNGKVGKINGLIYKALGQVTVMNIDIQLLPKVLISIGHAYDFFLLIFVAFPSIIIFFFLALHTVVFMQLHLDAERITPAESFLRRLHRCSPYYSTVMILMLVSAAMLFVGMTVGMFCADPIENVKGLVGNILKVERKDGAISPVAANATTPIDLNSVIDYFLQDNIPKKSQGIKSIVTLVEGTIGAISIAPIAFAPAITALGIFCDRLGSARLLKLLDDAIWEVRAILPLARRSKIHLIFKRTVINGVCGDLISNVFWLFWTNIVMAIVVVPIFRVLVKNYLTEIENWRIQKEEEREAAEMISRAEIRADKMDEFAMEEVSFFARLSRLVTGRPPYYDRMALTS